MKLVISSVLTVCRIIFVFLFVFSFLLTTYYNPPTILAAQSCSDDLYYWDTNANACIYKHGGYFDVDTNECAYAFDIVASDLCPPTPTPTRNPQCSPVTCRYSEEISTAECSSGVHWVEGTGCSGDNCTGCQFISPECSQVSCFIPSLTSTPTPTPVGVTPAPIIAGPEENAVYNAKRSLLPKGIEDAPKEQNLLDKIGQILTNPANLLNVLFNSNLATADRFYSQSESLNQSTVAKQITEKKDDSLINNLKNFLGGPVGFYGVNLPKIEGVGDSVKDFEEVKEQSFAPKGIKPITGQ